MADGSSISALQALLERPDLNWCLMDEDLSQTVGHQETNNPGVILSRLMRSPRLSLVGTSRVERLVVRWHQGGLCIERSTIAADLDGHALRMDKIDPRLDPKVVQQVLAAGAPSGEIPEDQRRILGVSAFFGQFLDLLADTEAPRILECATGAAPSSLILLAALLRFGRKAELVGLDESRPSIVAAGSLARSLGLAADFHVSTISSYRPSIVPDLLLAIHACGQASLDAIELGLAFGIRRIALVPCCAPAGSAQAAGLAHGGTTDDPLLRARLDDLGLLLDCKERLRLGGYEIRSFSVYLRPWQSVEIGLTAYLPPSLGQTMGWR